MPNPEKPEELIPYVAPEGEAPLTVGGELNKIASNISQARNQRGRALAYGCARGEQARRRGCDRDDRRTRRVVQRAIRRLFRDPLRRYDDQSLTVITAG